MKYIQTQSDLEAMLKAGRAVVFIYHAWSNLAVESRGVFEAWERKDAGKSSPAHCEFYQVAPDDQPYTWKWVNTVCEIGEANGAVVWLKNGTVVGRVADAGETGVKGLEQFTNHFFAVSNGEATANFAPGHAEPFDVELLKILCCPETRQELKLAASPVVETLNRRIASGQLQNRGGQTVADPINGGLVRTDGRFLYPLRDNIPILLVDEALPLA